MGRHSLAEHTGEVELRLEAETLGELFAEAARALAELQGGPPAGSPDVREEVRLSAPDRDALLVDWLNELVFLSERHKAIFGDVRVQAIEEGSLVASVAGRTTEELGLHVKAATFHGLDVRETPAGFVANVVLDV